MGENGKRIVRNYGRGVKIKFARHKVYVVSREERRPNLVNNTLPMYAVL